MSFAYFDNILTLLAEELQVPLPKVKEAWTNSFIKFYKADASILKKTTTKKTKSTDKPAEVKPKKTPEKLHSCDEPGCTVGVKNLSRPIDGKIFCSKHYKKACNAMKKSQDKAPAPKEPEVSHDDEDVKEDVHEEQDLEPEVDNESQSDSDIEEDEEDLSEEDPEILLSQLRKGLDTVFGKAVTDDNFEKIGTLAQYLKYFEANWHVIQLIYPDVIPYADVVKKVNGRSLKKKDLYQLFTGLPAVMAK